MITKNKLKRWATLGLTVALVLALVSFTIVSEEDHSNGHGESDAVESAEAGDHGDHGDKKEFNAGDVILHHVKDAHELHLFYWEVPLPIIIYDDGLKVFSSSHLYHGDTLYADVHGHKTPYIAHEGYAMLHEKIYKLDENNKFQIKHEDGHEVIEGKVLDFSITKNVSGMLVGVLILLLLFMRMGKKYRTGGDRAPKGFQSWMEPLIVFIRDDVAKPAIGHKYEKFMPFLLSLFFFILVGNMMGLLPFLGGMNWTGNIAITFVLASFVFIITSINGNKGYWEHIFWPPGIPIVLKVLLMIPIEIFGTIMKPVVLMLRLFANITAGHIIILAFTCLIFIMNINMGAGAGWGASIVALLFSVFMNFLELLVAFLQAYVFLLLASLYFGSAVEEAHH